MASEELERERLAFEKRKWEETRALERDKARWEKISMWASPAAIVVSLLTVAGSIYLNTREQKAQFDLKAAEVIIELRSVSESQNRAEGLAALLPDRFPADLSKRLQPLKDRPRRPEMDKRALLNLLLSAPRERRKDVLELWLAFYPEDRQLIPEGVVAFTQSR